MGISKIGSLFASNLDPVQRATVAGKGGSSDQSQNTKAQQSPASTDAVVFTRTATSRPPTPTTASSDDGRAERLKQLKDQVNSGAYRPDSEKVAVAVLKDLS